jgi:hypothetical protein
VPVAVSAGANRGNAGAAIGGALGGVAGAALLAAIYWYYFLRKKEPGEQSGSPGDKGGGNKSFTAVSPETSPCRGPNDEFQGPPAKAAWGFFWGDATSFKVAQEPPQQQPGLSDKAEAGALQSDPVEKEHKPAGLFNEQRRIGVAPEEEPNPSAGTVPDENGISGKLRTAALALDASSEDDSEKEELKPRKTLVALDASSEDDSEKEEFKPRKTLVHDAEQVLKAADGVITAKGFAAVQDMSGDDDAIAKDPLVPIVAVDKVRSSSLLVEGWNSGKSCKGVTLKQQPSGASEVTGAPPELAEVLQSDPVTKEANRSFESQLVEDWSNDFASGRVASATKNDMETLTEDDEAPPAPSALLKARQLSLDSDDELSAVESPVDSEDEEDIPVQTPIDFDDKASHVGSRVVSADELSAVESPVGSDDEEADPVQNPLDFDDKAGHLEPPAPADFDDEASAVFDGDDGASSVGSFNWQSM